MAILDENNVTRLSAMKESGVPHYEWTMGALSDLKDNLRPHYEHAKEVVADLKENLKPHVESGIETLADVKERLMLAHHESNVTLSDVKESLILLQKATRDAIQGHKLKEVLFQRDDNLLLWVLLSLLLALLIAFSVRRLLWKPAPPNAESVRVRAAARGADGMQNGRVDSNKTVFKSARMIARASASENKDKFFQLSARLCARAKIKVPPRMGIKSSRVWDVTMSSVKRWGGISIMHKQKKCRIALEIVGPISGQRTVDLSSSSKHFVVSLRGARRDGDGEEENDPVSEEGEYLADDEYINVRIFRLRKDVERKSTAHSLRDMVMPKEKKKDTSPTLTDASSMRSAKTIASQSTAPDLLAGLPPGGSEDEMDDFIYNQDNMLWPPDMNEWVSHKEYRGYDCEVNKQHENFVDVRLGSSALTGSGRELEFQSIEERESFGTLVSELGRLDANRARRQLKHFRQMKAKNGEQSDHSESGTDSSGDDQDATDETIQLLIEIVSATDLPGRYSMDPYVVVRMGDTVIHRTSVLVHTQNPIWTIKTGSLCLLKASPEDLIRTSTLKFQLVDFNTLAKNEVIGQMTLSVKQLVECKGDRVGFDINLNDDSVRDARPHAAQLFLRIREATAQDVEFMKDLENNFGKDGVYSGETLLPIRPPQSTLLKFQSKQGEESTLHRVRPYPDPKREEETTWLSTDDLFRESMMTSSHWVETGSGKLGTLHVEILGCTNLPNMDRACLGLKTDAFASIVFEDAAVTTDVVGQCLSPRWMPWSRRAFIFNLDNPNSSLFVGVFDHDPEPPTNLEFLSKVSHDPIGRLEVQVSNFEPDTIYTLAYPLYFGDDVHERSKKERGKVWIRLRKTWTDFNKAVLAGTRPPPITVVSSDRPIDYRVVKYTTAGPRDDTGFSIWKFTEYIEEIQNYEHFLRHIKDFVFNTWLWRSHCQLKIFGFKIFLPLHSMVAFFWGVVVTNDSDKLPSFLLFSIGWFLVACNEAVNKNPSPWHKCPGYGSNVGSVLLRQQPDPVTIAPYQHLRAASNFEAARARREQWAERESALLEEHQRLMKTDLHGFDGTDEYNNILDVTTGPSQDSILMRFLFPLKPILYPIQKQMRQLVIYCRVSTSVLFWEESQFAFWITTASFVGSVAVYKIPFSFLIGWILRISAWVFLGPWMRLFDRWFFQISKDGDSLTDAERDERVKERMREEYQSFIKKASNYQIQKENIVKMESMKRYMFGSHHARVPRFRETRFKDTPLPESYAEPYDALDFDEDMTTERKYGQKLTGDMIPKREFEAYSGRDGFEQGRKQPMFEMLAQKMRFIAPSRLFAQTRDNLIRASFSNMQHPHLRVEPPQLHLSKIQLIPKCPPRGSSESQSETELVRAPPSKKTKDKSLRNTNRASF